MKKIFYAFAIAAAAMMASSCELFELDNFEGPNATITGELLDAKTKQPLGLEVYSTSEWDWGTWSMKTTWTGGLVVVEDVSDRWEGSSEEQNWLPTFWGTYTNKRIFAGKYTVDPKNLPVYAPATPYVIDAKKGDNTFDMEFTPYARIINPTFTYDAANQKIVAKFKVELGDNTKANTIHEVRLCANTSNHVSNNFNLCKNDPGAKATMVKEGEEITLSIDCTATVNADEFMYNRNHYLRIAVLAKDAMGWQYNTKNWYNHSDVYVMDRNKSISKYDWSTAE